MTPQLSVISRIIIKHLVVAIVALLLGIGLGIGQLHAESKTVNVPGIGNVGTAETTGNATAGTSGRSTSTNNLFFLKAHIRIWHTGNILQAEHSRSWNNNQGGWTNNINSSGFGDYSVTLHEFRFTSGHSSTTVYTSQSGGWSCADAWVHYRGTTC